MTLEQRRNKLALEINAAGIELIERMEEVVNGFQDLKARSNLTYEQKEILDNRLSEHNENPKSGREWKAVKSDLSENHGL